MRIGIDGRALQDKPWSGVGQYTDGLLRALFDLDKENEYWVWYNAAGKLKVPDFSEYPNVRVYRTRWPNKVLNLLSMLFNNFTFYIFNFTLDVFFMPNLNFIALPADIRLVLTVHDLSFEHFSEHFFKHTQLVHKAVNPRALVKRASKIIAVSEHTKDDLMETYGIAPEKVNVVYPGIGQVLGVRDQVSELKPITYNLTLNPYILYFGALEPRKNILGIIEAYEKLKPRESLVLAGLSTPHVKKLKKRIAQSKLRDKIILVENPGEDQKTAIYAAASLFVYPSFYEGFGFPPLEAMAEGVPVIASSDSSVSEICDDAALLVSPWKIEEIKEGMRVLLEDEEVRTYYIEAGRRRVQEFSWQRCAKQILDILR